MKLKVSGIAVDCIIGDRPEERTKPQRVSVDLELEVPDAVAESDDLGDTADYVALSVRVREALAAAKCRMIERAAKVVCDACMATPNVFSAKATVTKRGAIEGVEATEATYESASAMHTVAAT